MYVALVTSVLSGTQVASPSAAQEPETRSVTDRVYSLEQAERGRTLFRDVCIICHADPFWRTSWEGRPLGDLYTKIVRFMPDDDPGSLRPDEAASAIAYILQASGFQAGTVELTTDVNVLNRLRVEAPPK